MPAYAIFIKNKTIDPDELKAYGKKAGGAGAGYPIIALALYGPLEVLEGDPAGGVLRLQFPDMDVAKAS